MRRTARFIKSQGSVNCRLETGEVIRLPLVPGLLKHPTMEQLQVLLEKPAVAKKYTIVALRRAPWPVLSLFQRSWLRRCIDEANLTPSRARAVEFMLK